jgi:hypothetical protein
MPSIPIVPVLGAAALFVLIAAAVWFFFLRKALSELASVTPDRVEAGRRSRSREALRKRGGRQHRPVQPGQGGDPAATDTEIEVVVPAGAKDAWASCQTKGGRSKPVSVTVQASTRSRASSPTSSSRARSCSCAARVQGQAIVAQVAGAARRPPSRRPPRSAGHVPSVRLPEGSKISLTLKVGFSAPRSFDCYLGRLFFVIEVSFLRGLVGDRVVLKKRGFRPDPKNNAVTFAGQTTLVLSATAAELAIVVPAPPPGDVPPELPIVITAAGRTSAGTTGFTLMRDSTSGFVPPSSPQRSPSTRREARFRLHRAWVCFSPGWRRRLFFYGGAGGEGGGGAERARGGSRF